MPFIADVAGPDDAQIHVDALAPKSFYRLDQQRQPFVFHDAAKEEKFERRTGCAPAWSGHAGESQIGVK